MNDVSEIPDSELLGRAVKSCRADYPKRVAHYRMTAVMDTFQLGSTYAQQLCARFDLDPFEKVKR